MNDLQDNTLENVIVKGDLSGLTTAQRLSYYKAVCESVGLNPITQPFEYITLSGKMSLYAKKAATDQLRSINGVSIAAPKIDYIDGLVVVTVTAADKKGRTDTDAGVVSIENLKGEQKSNALMKAITKAKRRVTLSICGLGMLDETEVESIPGATLKPALDQLPEPEPTGYHFYDCMIMSDDQISYMREKVLTAHDGKEALDCIFMFPQKPVIIKDGQDVLEQYYIGTKLPEDINDAA